eukprot:UN09450
MSVYCPCVFVWLTFGQFVKHCFCCFSKTFLGHRQMYDFVRLVVRFCSVFLPLALYPCLSMLALSDIIHFLVVFGR